MRALLVVAGMLAAVVFSDYLLAPFRIRVCYLSLRVLTDREVAAQLRPAILRLVNTTPSPPSTPTFAESAKEAFDHFEKCSSTNGFSRCKIADLERVYYYLNTDGNLAIFALREKTTDVRLEVATGFPGCDFISKTFGNFWTVDGKHYNPPSRKP